MPYLGGHDRYRPECELAYHNQLMVLLWSGLATGDARLPAAALRPDAADPAHDVVGDLRARPRRHRLGDHRHRRRGRRGSTASATGASSTTSTRGASRGSFARGALFQENEATGDARISGSTASLCGIEDALERGDDAALEAGIRRLVLLYSVAYSFGGIPLLYMGDELALRNDTGYLADPERAPDNRWMHRPPMDWAAAARRRRPRDARGPGVRLAAAARGGPPRAPGPARRRGVHASWTSATTPCSAWRRRHPRSGAFVGLANFSRAPQTVDADTVTGFGTFVPVLTSDGPPELRADRRAAARPRLRLVRRALSAGGRVRTGARPARPYRQHAADHQPTPRPGAAAAPTTAPLPCTGARVEVDQRESRTARAAAGRAPGAAPAPPSASRRSSTSSTRSATG